MDFLNFTPGGPLGITKGPNDDPVKSASVSSGPSSPKPPKKTGTQEDPSGYSLMDKSTMGSPPFSKKELKRGYRKL